MIVLYVGDVMGGPGLKVVERVLPELKTKNNVDLTVAQTENLSEGKGITINDFERLLSAGVDFCTGGNHSLYREEIWPKMADPDAPVIRPSNYPEGTPGLGYKYINTKTGKVLVVSLLGHVVGRDADKPVDNPLQAIDRILEKESGVQRAATIVNFHGDYSSEKRIIGYYLDGRVSMVVGDHWHIPTADADVLPKGTAHITDVGMCGSLDSSLGVRFDTLITRWRDGKQTRNILETEGRMQFNALLVDVDEATGLARRATLLRQIFAQP